MVIYLTLYGRALMVLNMTKKLDNKGLMLGIKKRAAQALSHSSNAPRWMLSLTGLLRDRLIAASLVKGSKILTKAHSLRIQKWFANQKLISSSLWKKSFDMRENFRIILFSSFPTLQCDRIVCLHCATRIEVRLPLSTIHPSKLSSGHPTPRVWSIT